MNPSSSAQYKKAWLVSTMIARDLIGMSEGDLLPTIAEYAEKLSSSRGIVQNALASLEEAGAIGLEKRGKRGTLLTSIDQAALFELGNLHYIMASMPPPLNRYFAALATGVCVSIAHCPATFNFGFMHSSSHRARALVRQVYDFVIVSHSSAKMLIKEYPDLAIALVMEKCLYSPPFYLCSNRKGVMEISDGDRIVADPNSDDQYNITLQLCEGKNVEIIHVPYLATRNVFDSGQADFIVQREDEWHVRGNQNIEQVKIQDQTEDMIRPVALVNKNNYGMDVIVRQYLNDEVISATQQAVLLGVQNPAFY